MDISHGAEGVLRQLQGSWHVSRVLWHADGTRARFAGLAEWRAEGDALRCVEEGEMLVAGLTPLAARRETLWSLCADAIEVAFGDGRPFHSFAPALRVTAEHDCAPDTYHLTYDFRAVRFWTCRWRVTGPRKDYRAMTRYSRVGERARGN